MSVRSRGARRVAAVAAAALAAGAITLLPGIAGLSAASASSGEVAYTCDVQLTGGQAAYGGEKPVTVTIDTGAPADATVGDTFSPAVTGTFTFDSTFASQFGPSPINRFSLDLDATTTTGANPGTIDLTSTTWQRGGGIGAPVPPMTVDLIGTWGTVTPTTAGTLDLGIGHLIGHIALGTTFSPNMTSYVIDCTPDLGAPTVDTVDVTRPDTSNYTCNLQMSGANAAYGGPTRVTIALSADAPATMETGQSVRPTVSGTLSFDDAFSDQLVPSQITGIRVDGVAHTTTGGAPGNLLLSSSAWMRVGGQDSPVPPITLDLTGVWEAISPTTVGDLDLQIGNLTGGTVMVRTQSVGYWTGYSLNCAADEPLDLGTIVVTQAPVPPTCTIDISPGAIRAGESATINVTTTTDDDAYFPGAQTVNGTVVPRWSWWSTSAPVVSYEDFLAFSSGDPEDVHTAGYRIYAPGTPFTDIDNGVATPLCGDEVTLLAPQSVTFPPVAGAPLSAGTVALVGSATSGLPVEFASTTPEVCTVTGATVTLLGPGTCTVTASQAGNGEYAAADPVTRSFLVQHVAVLPPTGVLTLTAPAGVALSAGTAVVRATATTPGTATVVTMTPAVCAVSSATSVRLLKPGTCTLRASQDGAVAVTTTFPVWGAPVIPAAGRATQVVPVLGLGESGYLVITNPAVCVRSGAAVVLLAPGRCAVTVKVDGRTVRTGAIDVAYRPHAQPSDNLQRGGTVYFAFNSAKLTTQAKRSLRRSARVLKDAPTVVVYGNTFGPGKNSAHSRKLAEARALAVVRFLRTLGVKAKPVTVAAAGENPVSPNPAKNRRADIYYLS